MKLGDLDSYGKRQSTAGCVPRARRNGFNDELRTNFIPNSAENPYPAEFSSPVTLDPAQKPYPSLSADTTLASQSTEMLPWNQPSASGFLGKTTATEQETPTAQDAMITSQPILPLTNRAVAQCGRTGLCWETDIIITGEMPAALPSKDATTQPAPDFASYPEEVDCRQCTLYYRSVSVYYPPAASSNTDCLTNGAIPSTDTIPSDLRP